MPTTAPFYEVNVPEDEGYKPYGVAYFPEGSALLHLLPRSFTPVADWPMPKATLRDGDYFDYLANNAAVRLMSGRLQGFIELQRAPGDSLQWLPVTVASDREDRCYHVLHFTSDLQPLHREATKWIGDWYPRVPVIRKELVDCHKIFGLRTTGYSFVVSADVRKQLRKEFAECFTYRPLSTA